MPRIGGFVISSRPAFGSSAACSLTSARAVFYTSFLWLRSQKGRFALRLQPHSQSFCASDTMNFCGVNAVVLCEPSQKGWRFESPHAHHQ